MRVRKFSKDAKLFLIIQILFALSNALSATFVNIYMWRLTADLKFIGLYNIIVYSIIPIAFILSGYIGRRKGITTCTRLGIIGYLVFYLTILLLRDNVKDYFLFIGAFYGIGMGFYWFGNNTLIYHYTEEKNRAYYLGVSSSVASIAATLAPVISGWVIVSQSQLKGYQTIFFIGFMLFAVSIVLSYFLTQVKEKGNYQLKEALFNKENKDWRKILISNFMTGINGGAVAYLINILVFMVLKNELNMGKFTTLTSVLGIASSFIVGRIYSRKLSGKLFLTGVLMCFAGNLAVVIWTNYTGIVINGILTAVFTCIWSIPYSTLSYEIAGRSSAKLNNLGDYMIAREIPISVGRICGILLYIAVSMTVVDTAAIRIILPILSFMLVLNYIYLRKTIKR
jgi:YQGE family putative transporter